MFFDDVDCSEDGKKNFHRVTFTPCESSNTTHVWCVLLLHTSSFSSFLRRRFLGGEEGEVRGGSGQLSIGGWMFWMTHAIIPSVTNLHKSVTSQAYSSQLRHFDESGLFINFSVVLFKFSFVRKKMWGMRRICESGPLGVHGLCEVSPGVADWNARWPHVYRNLHEERWSLIGSLVFLDKGWITDFLLNMLNKRSCYLSSHLMPTAISRVVD